LKIAKGTANYPLRRDYNPGVVLSIFLILFIILCPACRPRVKPVPAPKQGPVAPVGREYTGFTIQVGVFSSEENAARLTRSLRGLGIEASYFVHPSGMFKVQVGDYRLRPEAEREARSLLKNDYITEYFIVARRAAASKLSGRERDDGLRDDLAGTAQSFIDYPYAWGGTSADEGFDCSGLTMTVYRLNGLNLPRSLWAQFETGRTIPRSELSKGDLVFFDTAGNGRPSHVGIYIGNGLFIHAPGANKTIRADSLSNPYFAQRFVGGRAYFRP
jgi:cell wall-associated NlpC family hydrolase